MKGVLVLAFLSALGYYSYTQYVAEPKVSSSSVYTLKTVDTNPIPRKQFFQLWNDVALDACAESRSRLHMAPESCRSKVWENSAACTSRVGRTAPETINNLEVSRELGKAYMACAMPKLVCGGVEIKNEEEARQYCR